MKRSRAIINTDGGVPELDEIVINWSVNKNKLSSEFSVITNP